MQADTANVESLEQIEQKVDPVKGLAPQIAKGAGITFFGDVFGKVVNFVSQIVIARLLGAELFGLYALGLVVLNMGQTLSIIGLSQGALRYVSIFHGEGNHAKVKGTIVQTLGLPFLLGTLLGAGLFFGAGRIAMLFDNRALSPVLRVVALGIPIVAVMMVAVAITRGFKKMQYFVYVKNIVHPVANLVFVAVLCWLGFQVLGAILAWIFAAVLGLILSFYYIRKQFPRFSNVRASYVTRDLLRFSGPLVLVGFFQMVLFRTDVLMLGYFCTAAEVGVYNAVSQIMIALVMVLMAFSSIFAPMVADLCNKNRMQELNRLFKIVARWVFLLTLPIFAFMLISSKELLHIFGPEFVSGQTAFPVLALLFFVAISFGPLTETLVMSGFQKLELYNTLAGFVLNIVLNLLLIPQYGLVGAALATGISSVCLQAARLIEIGYFLKLSPFSKKYLKAMGLGLAVLAFSFGISSAFPSMYYLQSLFVNSVLVAILFMFSFCLMERNEEDELVLNTLKRKIVG